MFDPIDGDRHPAERAEEPVQLQLGIG